MIPINLVVEDELSETVMRKILSESTGHYTIGRTYGKGGYGYIKQKIEGFNKAATGIPFAVIVDLEDECPPVQIQRWLHNPINTNLIFRIAVNEIESWLLADRLNFASFLNIKRDAIPVNTDLIPKPKQFLISLVRTSGYRYLRESIVPREGSTARVGPDYNGELSRFVESKWNIEAAKENSESLRRAVNAIDTFKPSWLEQ